MLGEADGKSQGSAIDLLLLLLAVGSMARPVCISSKSKVDSKKHFLSLCTDDELNGRRSKGSIDFALIFNCMFELH